jgi:hypothetical protein
MCRLSFTTSGAVIRDANRQAAGLYSAPFPPH